MLLPALLAPPTTASIGHILHFSDVHLNISKSESSSSEDVPIRYFADAPLTLLESALRYAKEHVVANPKLFLYTGDHAVHGSLTDEFIAKVVETNVHTMESYYPSKRGMMDVTAIIGNADGNPDYHMEVTNPKTETNPSIELISSAWEDSLSAGHMNVLNRRGYLSYALNDRLHVITLNTVPYSFAWLDKTLAELQDAGKVAYIAGHIAPIVDSYGGDPQWHTKYIVKYKSIVGKYANVIKAQFFGHVHSLEFRVPVVSLDGADAESDTFQLLPMFMSGSISPLFGNNPSFMVWEYDTDTHEVRDYAVYASDIRNSKPRLEWKLLFKASDAYGLNSLSLTELSAFVRRAEQNVSLVEDYYWNMKARSPNAGACKDTVCHAKTLCSLKWWTTKGEYLACLDTIRLTMASHVVDYDNTKMSGSAAVIAEAPLNDSRMNGVLMTIGATALATAVAVVCVALTVYALRRSGILKYSTTYESVTTS
uniref:Uncharacterized protein n=1 Tax=Hyaloperonospora arabidopsidis (strain Emoy2) TaxID=559515 RepID=M4BNQ7_HYAAE